MRNVTVRAQFISRDVFKELRYEMSAAELGFAVMC
jgi:hypothetical protein